MGNKQNEQKQETNTFRNTFTNKPTKAGKSSKKTFLLSFDLRDVYYDRNNDVSQLTVGYIPRSLFLKRPGSGRLRGIQVFGIYTLVFFSNLMKI